MKLVDLRKLAIRRQVRIRFRFGKGLECVVTEHGIAQVPGLHAIPDFNLERELASASEFVLEPAETRSASGPKGAPQARQIGRGELASMVGSAGPGAATPGHEEE
jgi:hypothetical protein